MFDPTHNKTNTKELNISELNQYFYIIILNIEKNQQKKQHQYIFVVV